MNADEIHIYHVELHSAIRHINELEQTLTAQEKSRIAKFIFEKDRVIQTLSRGILKNILSRYLSVQPEELTILNDEYGKPYIDAGSREPEISFSLSHSGAMILYAVSLNRNVGIDLELIKEINSVDDLIKDNFSSDEIKALLPLAEKDKLIAFYSCWTKKEAYVKALGEGLSYPLNKFTVSVLSSNGTSLLHDENNDVSGWTLESIQINSSYAAALAAEGTSLVLIHYDWKF